MPCDSTASWSVNDSLEIGASVRILASWPDVCDKLLLPAPSHGRAQRNSYENQRRIPLPLRTTNTLCGNAARGESVRQATGHP
jgi:hypothetical protein